MHFCCWPQGIDCNNFGYALDVHYYYYTRLTASFLGQPG